MTKTFWVLGTALAASLAVTGYAQMPEGPPKTRAELQQRLAQHFKKADANGDGFVTKAEFQAARSAMKDEMEARHREHREKMFAMLDTNKDGQLSKEEFTAPHHDRMDGPDGGKDDHGAMMHGDMTHHGMHGHMAMMMMGPRGDAWFDRADANHDGKLSLAEASAGPLAMFDKVDSNHDGTISPQEHEAASASMRARWREHGDAMKPATDKG